MSLDASSPAGSANVFINYRREDTAGHAGRLFDRLSTRFPGQVFMDIDTLEPGVDFVEVIERAVSTCRLLIVLIGNTWLEARDLGGSRRLDDSADFVRIEIAMALQRKIRVIPVLVHGARMPRAEELPPDLANLARRNAIELSDARWAYDAERLIRTIEEILQPLDARAEVTGIPNRMEAAGAAPAGPTAGPRPVSAPRSPASRATKPRGAMILTLGILGVIGSFFMCGVTGPLAWSLGNRELRAIREGRSLAADQGSVRVGKVLGMIGTIIWIAYVLGMILYVALHR